MASYFIENTIIIKRVHENYTVLTGDLTSELYK